MPGKYLAMVRPRGKADLLLPSVANNVSCQMRQIDLSTLPLLYYDTVLRIKMSCRVFLVLPRDSTKSVLCTRKGNWSD